MTNKEAIEQLKQMPIHPEVSYEYMKTIYQAIELAIKALEREADLEQAVVNIKMSEEEIKQFKQMLQEHTSLCPITSDNVPTVERPQGEWIPVSERLPEVNIDPTTNDFEVVLCSTVWDIVRPYKFGKPIGHDKAHFWSSGGRIMDDYVIAWQPLPKPYKESENE